MSYFMNWVKYFCGRMIFLKSNILFRSILGIQKLQKKLCCLSYFKTARAKPTCPSWCNKPPWWRVEEGRWGQRSQCCTWEVHSLFPILPEYSNIKYTIETFDCDDRWEKAYIVMTHSVFQIYKYQGHYKGRIPQPNRMNFWKNSKRPLTPPSLIFRKSYCNFS